MSATERPHSEGLKSTLGLPASTRACLFDLDGVLTQTAKLHAAAWKQMFDEYLQTWSAQASELSRHGADVVVTDLAALLEHA